MLVQLGFVEWAGSVFDLAKTFLSAIGTAFGSFFSVVSELPPLFGSILLFVGIVSLVFIILEVF